MSYIEREELEKRINENIKPETIEEKALIEWCKDECIRQAYAMPRSDVVEVVRCKDCKFWGIPHANDVEKSHYCCRDNMWCMPLRFADDFCSYGERREE